MCTGAAVAPKARKLRMACRRSGSSRQERSGYGIKARSGALMTCAAASALLAFSCSPGLAANPHVVQPPVPVITPHPVPPPPPVHVPTPPPPPPVPPAVHVAPPPPPPPAVSAHAPPPPAAAP